MRVGILAWTKSDSLPLCAVQQVSYRGGAHYLVQFSGSWIVVTVAPNVVVCSIEARLICITC